MAEKELVNIVGSNNVLSPPKLLEEFSHDLSFAPRIKPRCVVRPGNIDELQGVVRWANETHTPLVPVSSGTPHYHGDTVPGVEGAVIIDLGRMKRIIRVDPRNKVAMIEPGVTFGELQAELAKSGLRAYTPLAPRAQKSVIGSMLEREPITFPSHHWDSTDPLLCVEVVFGTGDKFRTGEASGPDTIEEQWEMGKAQMNPFGHSHVDFQRLIAGSQGTIGIVTWATLKCCYLSKVNRALLAPSASLEPLIDLSYKMLKYRLGGHHFIVNGLNLACLLGSNPRQLVELRNKLPPWVLFISFEGYGILPEEKVQYEEVDCRAMAQSCHIEPASELSGASAEEVLYLMGRPSSEPFWKNRLKSGFQDIFFQTTLDKTPGFTAAMSDLAQQNTYYAEDIGVYIQPMVQGTSCHCEFDLYYDPASTAESDVIRQFLTCGAEQLLKMGAFFSRPYWSWKDVAYRNAAGTADMQRKIKKIFDPNGVLNPGKLCF